MACLDNALNLKNVSREMEDINTFRMQWALPTNPLDLLLPKKEAELVLAKEVGSVDGHDWVGSRLEMCHILGDNGGKTRHTTEW